MDDRFKIYVEQLQDGHIEKIQEEFSPEFIDLNDEEVSFSFPVTVNGEAYLASDELVLRLNAGTKALMRCAICNEFFPVNIELEGLYTAIPFEEIKSGIYNFKELLREEILLEMPEFAECKGGNCPSRKEIDRYLKKEVPDGKAKEDTYRPFADLDKKLEKPNKKKQH